MADPVAPAVAEPAFYVDSGGTLQQIPASQAGDAEALGWTPAPPEAVKAHLLEQKYGGAAGELKAGAAAAARALTFGGSDLALRGAGVEAETLRGLEEANPVASGAGTALGIAAPLILTLGMDAPAAGAQAGAVAARGAARAIAEKTAPAIIAKAGQAVTRSVAGAMPEAEGLLGRIVNQAISTGAGSAIEGAAYGAGQVVSEAALGDPNLTAQSAIAEIGAMAALGGGLGSVLGIAHEIVPRALGKARDTLAGAVTKAKMAYPEIGERLTGIAADDIRDLQTKVGKVFTNPKDVIKLQRDLGDSIESVANDMAKTRRALYGEARPVETEALLKDVDPATLMAKAAEARQRVADELTSKIAAVTENPDLIRKGLAGEFKEIHDGFLRRTADGNPLSVFEELRLTRQRLDELSGWVKSTRDLPPLAQRNAEILARDTRGLVRDVVTDESIWGAAGARQAALDAADSEYRSALKVLQGGKLGPLNANLLRKVVDGGVEELQLNPRALRTFLNQMGDPRSDRIVDALTDYLKASDGFAREMEASFAHVPKANFDREALTSLVDKTHTLVGQAEQQASVTRLMHEMSPDGAAGFGAGGAKALLPPVGGSGAAEGVGILAAAPILGHMIPGAGPVAAAYGAAKAGFHVFEGLKNVPQTVMLLSRLERAAQRVSSAIDSGASTLVRGGPRAESVGRAEVVAGIAREFAASPEDSIRRFNRRSADIQRLSSDPEALHKAIVAQNEGVDEHAPNTAQALSVASARAVSFLASKLPQAPLRGPLAPKWEPSQSEVAKFARYYEAVKDPLVVLKQAASGTLTPEAVEAVQTVYPDLMAKVRASLIEKMAGRSGSVPARSRIALSLLIGEDVDGSLGMLPRNQAVFQGPRQQKQNAVPAIKPSSNALGRITVASRAMTPLEASTHRR